MQLLPKYTILRIIPIGGDATLTRVFCLNHNISGCETFPTNQSNHKKTR